MTRSLPLARALAQRRLLATIAAIVLVATAALSFALGWATGALRDAVVHTVAAAAPQARQTDLQVPVGSDAATATDGVDRVLEGLFGTSMRVAHHPADSGGTAHWVLTVDPHRYDPWSTERFAADLADLDVQVRAVPGLAPQGASVDGDLATTLAAASGLVRAVEAVAPVSAALIAISAIVGMLQLSGLVGGARIREAALLRSRGLDRRSARRMAAVEAAAVVVVAAAIGWMAAVAMLPATGESLPVAMAATWPVPVVAAIALTITASLGAQRAERPTGDDPRRLITSGAAIAVGVLVVAAGAALWQLAGLRGDAATLTASAWALAVIGLAPALGLAAVAAIALVLFRPVAAAVAATARRRRGLAPAVPATIAARQASTYGVVVALLALATAGAGFAGASVATWQAAAGTTVTLVAGADARGVSDDVGVDAADVARVAGSRQVASAAGALTAPASAGGAELGLVALPEASVARLVSPVPAAGVDPAALQRAIGGDDSGTLGRALPKDATSITMTSTVSIRITETDLAVVGTLPSVPDAAMFEGSAWLVDAAGTPARARFSYTLEPDPASVPEVAPDPADPEPSAAPGGPTSGRLVATATLPKGEAPWTLVGIVDGLTNGPGSHPVYVTRTGLTVTGSGGPSTLDWPGNADVVYQDQDFVSAAMFAPVPADVPVVVTRGLADALDLAVGSTAEVALDTTGSVVPGRVTEIVAAVPGTSSGAAVLVPYDRAMQVMVAKAHVADLPNELWASGDGAVAAVATALPQATVVRADPAGSLTAALTTPWWIAVIVVALLAGVALVAAAIGGAQQRGTEAFALAALGVTPRRQARSRAGELAVAAGAAVVLGAVCAVPLSLAAVPVLTRAAVPGAPQAVSDALAAGPLPVVIVAAVVVVAVVAASLVVGTIIRRQCAERLQGVE